MNKRQHFNKFIEPKAQLIERTSTNSPSSSFLGSFLKCTINGKVTTVFPSEQPPQGTLSAVPISLSTLPELVFIVTEFDYENMLTPFWAKQRKKVVCQHQLELPFRGAGSGKEIVDRCLTLPHFTLTHHYCISEGDR